MDEKPELTIVLCGLSGTELHNVPWFINCLYHCYLYRSLQTWLLSTINSLSLNDPVPSRSRTLLFVLSWKVPSHVISLDPILRSLHWLRITERIEYKLLSLTYKVLTTTQVPYLHKLISTQRPRSTCSSSVVTLAATFIILSKNNWSLLPLCFTLSLESAPFVPS